MNTTTTKSPGCNEYHHSVLSFYTQITREYCHFRRPSFTEYRQKKKYERVFNETALLAIFSHILPLNTTTFYAFGLKKICAIRHICHSRLFYIHGETIIGNLVATQWGLKTDQGVFFNIDVFFLYVEIFVKHHCVVAGFEIASDH